MTLESQTNPKVGTAGVSDPLPEGNRLGRAKNVGCESSAERLDLLGSIWVFGSLVDIRSAVRNAERPSRISR